jgi:hypothetical protein
MRGVSCAAAVSMTRVQCGAQTANDTSILRGIRRFSGLNALKAYVYESGYR